MSNGTLGGGGGRPPTLQLLRAAGEEPPPYKWNWHLPESGPEGGLSAATPTTAGSAIVVFLILSGIFLALTGCYRGKPSDKPPVHLVPDMDRQPKYLPQAHSDFFPNGSTNQIPPEGTIAQGGLHSDHAYYEGIDPSTGQPVKKSPVPITLTGLQRGQERFNIYCSPCHSRVGDGQGIMVQRGYVPPPSFHTDLIRQYPDGHIFQVISNGIRNMPSYGQQIPIPDRWLIVNYLRALQRSQFARVEDVPETIKRDLQVK